MHAIRVLLLLFVVVALGVGPAQAHTSLVSSDPADGSRLDAPPEQVVLTFSENLRQPSEASLVVDGEAVDASVEVDGSRVLVSPTGDASDGSYQVHYRVVSADGHPVTGTVAFAVGTGSVAESDSGEPADDADGGGVPAPVWWLAGVVVIVAVAGLALRGRRSR